MKAFKQIDPRLRGFNFHNLLDEVKQLPQQLQDEFEIQVADLLYDDVYDHLDLYDVLLILDTFGKYKKKAYTFFHEWKVQYHPELLNDS